MEKEELLISENQIAFDLESLVEELEDEESASLPEGFVVAKNHDYVEKEVLFVVVKERNFGVDLCGKTMLDWVMIAGGNCEKAIVEKSDNLFSSLRALNTDKPYIAVFYSNTPLLEKRAFHKLMDYFCKSNMSALALKKGYIFKTEFVRTHDALSSGKVYDLEDKSFYEVSSSAALAQASKYLYDKIKAFHLKNGVTMYGADTIFIDADVEIESSVVIYPHNVLKGQSYIGNNVTLEFGNYICDSIISDNSSLISSHVEKSKISEGSHIGPYEKFVNREG